MASPAQVLANHANAQQSTGPRTEEGKAASSANATKTGLTSINLFVRPGDEAVYIEFQTQFYNDFKPIGAVQNNLFHVILHASWNIRHCLQLDGEIRAAAADAGIAEPLLHDETTKKLDRIYRYKKMHESSKRQATAQLRQLQNEQQWRTEVEEFEDAPILVEAAKVLAKTESINATRSRTKLNNLRGDLEIFASPNVRRAIDAKANVQAKAA